MPSVMTSILLEFIVVDPIPSMGIFGMTSYPSMGRHKLLKLFMAEERFAFLGRIVLANFR